MHSETPSGQRISAHISALADRLWEISLELHRNPELSYREYRAAALLAGELESSGFAVEREVAGLPTAFVGNIGSGDSPRVALLLEYDALPELGHACGHNLIATAGLGAALALQPLVQATGGTLLVVGTPAEEDGGGKIAEVEAGVFEGVDAALMFHPGVYNWSWAPLTAMVELRIAFHGKAAHPTGNPQDGVDALGTLIRTFNELEVLSQSLPDGSHVQGIIIRGGEVTNIIPDFAEGRFGLRALTTSALDRLLDQVRACAEQAARETSAAVVIEKLGATYTHFRSNPVLAGTFSRHLARLGISATEPLPGVYLGSSDIGNVSTKVPTIHPFLQILPPDQSDHTPAFTAAAAGEYGKAAMLAAAEALAFTAFDVLSDPAVAEQAWTAFRNQAASEQSGPQLRQHAM
ncbi:amidohydrolase [Nonomuraea sediminis]|uniref:amidohydrolase n=1 Tax=Nonomuraea sediminis TaxID=2835864 RepID=UPI001BDCA473|nr:amidohydrolase [Nonomuraea sediminis]